MTVETIHHAIEPVFDERSRILMLGTMPSPKSRETGFYYGHPQNRFWPVMARILGESLPQDIAGKRSMMLRNCIALWDVLASCDIEGASDASIRNPRPNDITRITTKADICAIFCTGSKSYELFMRLSADGTNAPIMKLPSTSPANASWKTDGLVQAYGDAILPYLKACPDEGKILPYR